MLGVRGYVRGARVYPGCEGMSGVRGYVRDSDVIVEGLATFAMTSHGDK